MQFVKTKKHAFCVLFLYPHKSLRRAYLWHVRTALQGQRKYFLDKSYVSMIYLRGKKGGNNKMLKELNFYVKTKVPRECHQT